MPDENAPDCADPTGTEKSPLAVHFPPIDLAQWPYTEIKPGDGSDKFEYDDIEISVGPWSSSQSFSFTFQFADSTTSAPFPSGTPSVSSTATDASDENAYNYATSTVWVAPTATTPPSVNVTLGLGSQTAWPDTIAITIVLTYEPMAPKPVITA